MVINQQQTAETAGELTLGTVTPGTVTPVDADKRGARPWAVVRDKARQALRQRLQMETADLATRIKRMHD
jgi:hypothetical protein